jgi:hypothetical protein
MLLFILIPLIIALCQGYSLRRLLTAIELLPLGITCIVHAVFIIFAWCGDHSFVQYADWVQRAMILSLIPPILRHRLAKPALIGTAMTLVGTAMNHIVIDANVGKMPVYPTLSKWIGYVDVAQLDGSIDSFHVLLNESSKLPFLADYIDLGVCIISAGDVLIHAFASIVLYYTIKAICPQKENTLERQTVQ